MIEIWKYITEETKLGLQDNIAVIIGLNYLYRVLKKFETFGI